MINATKHARFTLALLCGLMSASAVATTETRTDGADDITVRVPLTDINLSNQAGVETLYQRLQSAARQICGPQQYKAAGSLRQVKLNQQCYVKALDRAVSEAGNELLTKIHTS
jgi:UrcA family protein